MTTINLLPPEIKSKINQSKKTANVFSICLVLILFTILIAFGLYELKKDYLTVLLQNTQADIASVNSSLSKYDKLEQEALFINNRVKLAQTVESKRPLWSAIVQGMLNSVPTDVQFTSLTCDTSKKPNFVLQASTTSEREVIKFRDKLESSYYFKDVAFKSSAVSTGNSTDNKQSQVINFSLEFNLEQLAPKTSTSGGGQ